MSRFLRFPGGRSKVFTISCDDCSVDIVRLIEIMKKTGVKGSFNLNSGRYGCNCFGVEGDGYLTEEQLKECLIGSGMEVAIHGYKHLNPETISGAELFREFAFDKENLEKTFQPIVRGAAYAFGGVNDRVVSVLDNLGIAYARTIVNTNSFDMPSDWLRLNPTCHHNSMNLKELTEIFLSTDPNKGGGRSYPMMFYVWGHAVEFTRNDNWADAEELCKKIGESDEVWKATSIEIYDYVKAFESLHFSADGKTVLNNTPIDVCFYSDGQIKTAYKASITKI